MDKSCPHYTTQPKTITEISGTSIRALLKQGKRCLPHIMRPEVIDSLENMELFVTS